MDFEYLDKLLAYIEDFKIEQDPIVRQAKIDAFYKILNDGNKKLDEPKG